MWKEDADVRLADMQSRELHKRIKAQLPCWHRSHARKNGAYEQGAALQVQHAKQSPQDT